MAHDRNAQQHEEMKEVMHNPDDQSMMNFRAKSWQHCENSWFLEKIPYTSTFLEVMNRRLRFDFTGKCECTEDCNCHWDPDLQMTCKCGLNDQECGDGCKACDRIFASGRKDNRQNERKGVYGISFQRKFIEGYGDSIIAGEDFEKGQFLFRISGIVVREENVCKEEKYAVSLGKFKFRLKQDYYHSNQGEEHFDQNWTMVSSHYGNDGNYTNHSCINHNAVMLVVFYDSLPHPILYATKDGNKGLFVYVFIL